jgi:glycosyltransferase involved in cell wall biosynthesis
MLHFNHFLYWHPGVELVIVDDGSQRPLRDVVPCGLQYNYRVVETNDTRPWTQGCARNAGARVSNSDFLLFVDVDHVLTEGCIMQVEMTAYDRMNFRRRHGVLDSSGNIITDPETLRQYFVNKKYRQIDSSPFNIYAMRRSVFIDCGGYDESIEGIYGGKDTAFQKRYSQYRAKHKTTNAPRPGGIMYAIPQAAQDVQGVLHHLSRGDFIQRAKEEKEKRREEKQRRKKEKLRKRNHSLA